MAVPSSTRPPPDPLVPANFGGWFAKIIEVIRRSFVRLLVIQIGLLVLSVVPIAMVSTIETPRDVTGERIGLYFAGILIFLILTTVSQLTSFVIAITDSAGESINAGTTVMLSRGRIIPLIVWSILSVIITSIGFIFLLIPGIYFSIVFGASLIGVIAVERKNIGRCFRLVNQRFWPTTGRMLFVFLIFLVYIAISIGIDYSLGENSVVTGVLGWILSIIVGLFGVGVSVVTYAELRFHENPTVLTPTLVAELRHGTG